MASIAQFQRIVKLQQQLEPIYDAILTGTTTRITYRSMRDHLLVDITARMVRREHGKRFQLQKTAGKRYFWYCGPRQHGDGSAEMQAYLTQHATAHVDDLGRWFAESAADSDEWEELTRTS